MWGSNEGIELYTERIDLRGCRRKVEEMVEEELTKIQCGKELYTRHL